MFFHSEVSPGGIGHYEHAPVRLTDELHAADHQGCARDIAEGRSRLVILHEKSPFWDVSPSIRPDQAIR